MIIESSDKFDDLVSEYQAKCKEDGKPMILTGLILHLGLSSRQSLDQYAERDEFYDSVKRAKLMIEAEYEQRLFGNSATGSIFALKNFGWSDKQELDHSSSDGSMTPAPTRIELVAPDDNSKD